MDQDKVLHESFKLWEQFATTYSSIMFDAMEQTIKQSEALKEQMDEAVGQALKTWQIPITTDQDKTVEIINELSSQVEALAERIAALEANLKEE